jgi:hypothetical protein
LVGNDEATIKPGGFLMPYPFCDMYPGGTERRHTTTSYLGKGIATADYDALNARAHDKVGTGRCFAVMGARFKVNKEGGIGEPRVISKGSHRIDLGVWATEVLMEARCNDGVIMNENRPNKRVGQNVSPSLRGEGECCIHKCFHGGREELSGKG